jgi:hypothetical protein
MCRYYHICRSYRGHPVAIRTRTGRVYRGLIHYVTPHTVCLRPLGRPMEGGEAVQPQCTQTVGDKRKAAGEEIYSFFPIIPLAAIAGITLIGLASLKKIWW